MPRPSSLSLLWLLKLNIIKAGRVCVVTRRLRLCFVLYVNDMEFVDREC